MPDHLPYTLHLGDCLLVLKTFPDNSFDSVVTDPPYGIRFMGKAWDGADIEARAARRAEMPSHAPDAGPNGGHRSVAAEAGKYDLTPKGMLAFQAFTLEWAADCLRVLKPGGHLLSFASPRTYHHMAVGIEMAGFEIRDQIMWVFGSGFPKSHNLSGEYEGWGTALKPGHEPICMARKPLAGTVARNVLAHGTGALNIDRCRIP
uniref:DNA methyltransferase n=1 Tax=Pseudomonas aeruginosa TaxID=287 RepID=UPI0013CDFDEC